MKIGILFNCQAPGLARCMQRLRPDDDIIHFTFMRLIRSRAARVEAGEALRGCDVVVTAASNPFELGPAAPERLRARGVTVQPLPSIYFSGFHPDLCAGVYRNEAGEERKFTGPTGAMHSRIAIAGYLAGLSVTDTAALYNRLVFARLGYLDRFGQQQALLLEKFRDVLGLDLSPRFDEWLASGCFMHSDNHPRIAVLADVAHIACDVLGLPASPLLQGGLPDDELSLMPAHPVYADIAKPLGVEPTTIFRGGTRLEPLRLGIDEYLARSYQAFQAIPDGLLYNVRDIAGTMRALELAPRGVAVA